MKKIFTVIIVAIFLSAGSVIASKLITIDHNHEGDSVSHSGRTNSEGCHNDNVHGGYHCH